MRALLEQSQAEGDFFYSKITTNAKGKQRLASRKVSRHEITIESGQRIRLWLLINDPFHYYLETKANFYYYENGEKLQVLNKPVQLPKRKYNVIDYCFGQARYQGKLCNYFSIDDYSDVQGFVDLNSIKPPSSLVGYPYNMRFNYDQHLIDLMGNLHATFVDQFKRPLNINQFKYGHYYPSSMKKSTYHFKDLATAHLRFPIVVELNAQPGDPPLATLDLEPHFTPEELAKAESFDYYYVEETPRGGRHYLIKPDNTDAFKYRISEHLEVQVKTMITFYGLCGHFVKSDVQVSDLSSYKEVGKSSIPAPIIHKEINYSPMTNDLYKNTAEQMGIDDLLNDYNHDPDTSHAEFWLMANLWRRGLANWLSRIDHEQVPWILAEYASKILPPRPKHEELRDGVPYLVYVAATVLHWFGFVYLPQK